MTYSIESDSKLVETRNKLRGELAKVPCVFEKQPKYWVRNLYREIKNIERDYLSFPEEIQEFLDPLLMRARTTVKREVEYGKGSNQVEITDDERSVRAEIHLMQISQDMAARFQPETEPIGEHVVSIDELIDRRPGCFKKYTKDNNGIALNIFAIKHPEKDKWFDLPMPFNGHMWHKGGPARVILGMYAGAPISMVKNELPWNDLDVIYTGDERIARGEANLLGVDPEGVEEIEYPFNFSNFCLSRDTTQNQVCFGNDGLHFSEDAINSAKTGHIKISSHYMPQKAIYGVEQFKYQRKTLITPRGLMREMKSVAEGKALSFDYTDLNANLDLGIYWLFLANKWSKRENFSELLQKMFEIGKRMKQVRSNEINIFDTLRRVHIEFPFFNFESKMMDMTDVVRWKSKKFVKQLDREFGWLYKVPTGHEIKRTPGDTKPRRISLEGFTPSEEVDLMIQKNWPIFIEECKVRNTQHQKMELNSYLNIFNGNINPNNPVNPNL